MISGNEDAKTYQNDLNLRHFGKVQYHSHQLKICGFVLLGVSFVCGIVLSLFIYLWAQSSSNFRYWDEIPNKNEYYLYATVFSTLLLLILAFFHWMAYSQFERYA